MSLQFGKFHFNGIPSDSSGLDQARALLAPYSPDPDGSYSDGDVQIIYRAFYTTEESQQERHPYISQSGVVVSWDGRLDNRSDLISEIGGRLSNRSSDVEITAAAYDRFSTDCFQRFVGDWALSIWIPRERTVVLATDFVGTRHLYYRRTEDQVIWSTVLDALILDTRQSFELDEQYIAGWLSQFPAAHLTPYHGVLNVPPCSFVRVSKHAWLTRKYWEFDPGRRIRYRTDSEYEEHFRIAFGDAVKRRLRSASPVVAELSGGVDSSSIVCVADDILAHESGPRLDTVSYYDDSEPNWDERPLFTKIEKRRGRTGCHINLHDEVRQEGALPSEYGLTPAETGRNSHAYLQLAACLKQSGSRVLLSGIGGDEVLGGVPNPLPELADLLASGRIGALSHQLKVWALSLRKPWIHLFRDTLLLFAPSPGSCFRSLNLRKFPCWVSAGFIARNQPALSGYRSRVQMMGAAPSFQENLYTLEGLRRQLASFPLPIDPLHEVRYPYLDRDLLEFLYAIPRQQLVRPKERRSLMRRALKGIVPEEVLNRRRKAFVIRSPIIIISEQLARITEKKELTMSSFGVVDRAQLLEEMRRAVCGADVPIVPLLRAFTLEAWITTVVGRKVLADVA